MPEVIFDRAEFGGELGVVSVETLAWLTGLSTRQVTRRGLGQSGGKRRGWFPKAHRLGHPRGPIAFRVAEVEAFLAEIAQDN